jgi:hypothetical protein
MGAENSRVCGGGLLSGGGGGGEDGGGAGGGASEEARREEAARRFQALLPNYERLFSQYDTDTDGLLSKKEFRLFYRDVLMAQGKSKEEADDVTTSSYMGTEKAAAMFAAYDKDYDQRISFREFWGHPHTAALMPQSLEQVAAAEAFFAHWKPRPISKVKRKHVSVPQQREKHPAAQRALTARHQRSLRDAAGTLSTSHTSEFSEPAFDARSADGSIDRAASEPDDVAAAAAAAGAHPRRSGSDPQPPASGSLRRGQVVEWEAWSRQFEEEERQRQLARPVAGGSAYLSSQSVDRALRRANGVSGTAPVPLAVSHHLSARSLTPASRAMLRLQRPAVMQAFREHGADAKRSHTLALISAIPVGGYNALQHQMAPQPQHPQQHPQKQQQQQQKQQQQQPEAEDEEVYFRAPAAPVEVDSD